MTKPPLSVRALAALLVGCLALLAPAGALAREAPYQVLVGDTPVEPAILANDRLLVPLAPLGKALGFVTAEDPGAGVAAWTRLDLVLKFRAGESSVTINGAPRNMGLPATVSDNRFWVPLRGLMDILLLQLEHDGATRTVRVEVPAGVVQSRARALLTKSMQHALAPNMDADLEMTMTMKVANPEGGGDLEFQTVAQMQIQARGQDSLASMQMALPMGGPVIEMGTAMRGGKIYLKPPQEDWTLMDVPQAGMLDPARMVSELLGLYGKARLTLGAGESIAGVRTSRVDLVLPGQELLGAMAGLFGQAGLADQELDLAGELGQFMEFGDIRMSLLIDPDTGFTYRTTAAMAMALDFSALGEPEDGAPAPRMEMALDMRMDAVPAITPIQWPDLPE